MINFFKRGIETLRQPDRQPRCYEFTDAERLHKARMWSARNVWNDFVLSAEDQLASQLPKDIYDKE